MIAYFNGKFLEENEIYLSPYERGFQFADGVYEVIRFYYDHFFQTEAHLERMAKGLSELRIKKPDFNEFKNIIEHLIKVNKLSGDQAIAYIQITRGAYTPRRHWFPPEDTQATIFISASAFNPHQDEIDNGVKIILEPDVRWLRCDIKSIALLPNVLARQKAIDNGATEAIFVRDEFVTEGTHTNFCAIKNGKLFTHPLSNLILPGVTRQVVLKICQELNIPVKEIPIKKSDLKSFDELLLVGTTVEITPIIQVNDWTVGNGKPGPITKNIQKLFYDIIRQK